MEWILSVMATDRPGLVERIARQVQQHGGNWEESSLSRLAGHFAGIIRITLADDKADALKKALEGLAVDGLTVNMASGTQSQQEAEPKQVELELVGHDKPGIVSEVSTVLASLGINVDTLTTRVESSSMTAEPLFRAEAHLTLPGQLELDVLQSRLEAIANDLMVDISFS
ncbi:glycine cleavage system protein R [Pokkaliibacter plantistimulans]|uniref:Glycine cleavage system transcriptional repressor n=1 Tax=Pokkaliibacter plantistimulans TaxID=1635171 RepID=A0ABX5M253_9GAMM|nr:ACT domain-containing protein [Pokkaliibacter plantistimulans]PXF32566.1 glycine cleavage system protein R [Pokkaliibacter plantistimulans]